ncbi:cupin domain-containing protein [Pseudomonas vranovensis]|uniref:Cupin n=1 Tax=Pseudomonas vranovensis TaxID=321661 RepID=A0A423DH14_9PSED|nr:cupin domain-containing protein [Pseudomonas vranovensis]ROL70803.1 cupin [Pseudomonas vranovensis]
MNPHLSEIDPQTMLGNRRLLYFEDDGATPNSRLPVLLYHLRLAPQSDAAAGFESLFRAHQWPPLWRAGIFSYQHYHSNAHEALGVACGHAQVMLGGAQGQLLGLKRGDVLVLPAGTGHCCIDSSEDFLVVGAYPLGQQDYDIQRPGAQTHDASQARIAQVPLPCQDPVIGTGGWLASAWHVLTDPA